MEVLYRAVAKLGQTVDFLLTAHRNLTATRRFFGCAIDLHDVPEKVTIDKSRCQYGGRARHHRRQRRAQVLSDADHFYSLATR